MRQHHQAYRPVPALPGCRGDVLPPTPSRVTRVTRNGDSSRASCSIPVCRSQSSPFVAIAPPAAPASDRTSVWYLYRPAAPAPFSNFSLRSRAYSNYHRRSRSGTAAASRSPHRWLSRTACLRLILSRCEHEAFFWKSICVDRVTILEQARKLALGVRCTCRKFKGRLPLP